MLVVGYADGIRAVVHGSGNLLTLEWSGEVARYFIRPFDNLNGQRQMVRHLQETMAEDEYVSTIGDAISMEYLSRRRVRKVQWFVEHGWWEDRQRLPRRILITPGIGSYGKLDAAAYRWFEANCELRAQFGDYVLYSVIGEYPEDPGIFDTMWGRVRSPGT